MEPQPTNIDAIVALKPGAKWRYAVNSSGTTSLVWEDESITQPTDAEIATKLTEKYGKGSINLETGTFTPIK